MKWQGQEFVSKDCAVNLRLDLVLFLHQGGSNISLISVFFWLYLALPSGGDRRWQWLPTREVVVPSPSLEILKKPSEHGPGQWPCLTRGLVDHRAPHSIEWPARGGAGHGTSVPECCCVSSKGQLWSTCLAHRVVLTMC